MTFVSYAQNFEDVLLWRALKCVERGFYIDVGAAHPDGDSVTRAFYDRGWRGINVEPTREYFSRLVAARPRDTNIQAALSDMAGQVDIYVVPGTGLSTIEPDVAKDYTGQGFAVEVQRTLVDTLAGVCRQHAEPQIHFLKIDVEGAERAVLEGADLQAFRPWIILIESTRPMSTEETHAAWEPILLDAGYRFVWFDGLNRFYVAAEQLTALSPHFRTPPNVFDDFLRVADTEWARRIHEAEAANVELRQRATVAETWAAAADNRSAALYPELLRSGATTVAEVRASMQHAASQARITADRDLAWERERANVAELRMGWERERADVAELKLGWALNSNSWRITRPIRQLTTLLRQPRPAETPKAPAPQRAEPPIPQISARAEPQVLGAEVLPMPALPRNAPRAPRAVRRVHQFHSGSAVGDAVTNALLLTRGTLRAMGYESEIFVEHRDPRLEHELRLLGEIPRHGDQVLIVHHSMGFAAFPQIVALEATKILCYHNITPPELLAGNPTMQAYSELGRRQLALWRPHVAVALAVSDYNAIELRSLGFDPVLTCTMLFDIEQMRGRAVRKPALPTTCFTVLFVGRVAASKGQLELIAAYARFREGYAGASRLVLVGSLEPGTGYLEAMYDLIADAGLAEHVLILGHIPDAELEAWYATADLYVSLSAHEGFGVPLIEAMARSVAVLAWASGAVPYTMDGAPGLLLDRSATAVAGRMLELASHPGALAELRQLQRMATDRFQLHLQLPNLTLALALAGAAPPANAADRAMMDRHMLITVAGHASGNYSLSAVNRTLALALDHARPGQVRLASTEVDGPAPITGPPADIEDRVMALAERPNFVSGPHVIISNRYPILVPREPGALSMALFYWEESLIPAISIATLNAGFAGVLAPTRSVLKALVDSGLTIPVRLLGQALDLAPFQAIDRARCASRTSVVSFLHVSSCFPRKGVDVLLAAYARAFSASDPVRLVIKGFPNPHNDVAEQIEALRLTHPDLAEIELIDRELEAPALLELYAQANAMVLPTRGEGFNMAAAEAMAAGLPLIVTGAGGHMDFCGDDTARLLAWRHAPSQSHLAMPHSLWSEPDADDLVAALRETAAACRSAGDGNQLLAARSRRAAAAIARTTSPKLIAHRVRETALDLLLAPLPMPHRIAVVTTWGVRCGVAEYSRHLLEHLPESDLVAGITVLADLRTAAGDRDATPRVLSAWTLGDTTESTVGLAAAISEEDPSIVLVQHQPGLFDFTALAQLLQSPGLAGRVVCVTLHNVQVLVEEKATARTAALAALAAVARVVVHTLADLERMRGMGLSDNVTMMPQGVLPPGPAAPIRTFSDAAAPRIGCYGFFLPDKGIGELIEALVPLRRTWPGVRLRLVNAKYSNPVSRDEIARCRAIAATAGLEDSIEWYTEFLPDAESRALLAECDVLVLPTQKSQEGSSASLRGLLTAGAPVMVTPLALFDEAGPAVVRAPGFSAEDLAEGLRRLLTDVPLRAAVQAQAQTWLETRGWNQVASRLLGMLLALAAQSKPTGSPDKA